MNGPELHIDGRRPTNLCADGEVGAQQLWYFVADATWGNQRYLESGVRFGSQTDICDVLTKRLVNCGPMRRILRSERRAADQVSGAMQQRVLRDSAPQQIE